MRIEEKIYSSCIHGSKRMIYLCSVLFYVYITLHPKFALHPFHLFFGFTYLSRPSSFSACPVGVSESWYSRYFSYLFAKTFPQVKQRTGIIIYICSLQPRNSDFKSFSRPILSETSVLKSRLPYAHEQMSW